MGDYTQLVDDAFLDELKALYPSQESNLQRIATSEGAAPSTQGSSERNPWHIVGAVAYCASNRPEAIPHVLRFALAGAGDDLDARLRVVREIRDGLFKGGLTGGYSRSINALSALYEATPEELRENIPLRDVSAPIEEHARRGEEFFRSMYGQEADSVQGLLNNICPDLGWFSNTIGYGFTYGFTRVTSQLDTTYILVAALIAVDTPQQVAWHLANARRSGASRAQAAAVREIAMRVAGRCGVVWRSGVPEVGEE